MSSTISKTLPKILCLHGYGQNSTIFAKKTGYLRPYLKNQLEFVYVNAPNPLEDDHQFVVQMKELLKEQGKSNDYEALNYWFNRVDDKYVMFHQTIDYINKVLREQGPFVGILGFSQGAIFTSILTTLLEQNHPLIKPSNHGALKFSVMISGFFPRDKEIAALFQLPVKTPSLHVIGDEDPVVTPEMSLDLSERFNDPKVIRHPGGHVLPTKAEYRKAIIEFIGSNLRSTNATGGANGANL